MNRIIPFSLAQPGMVLAEAAAVEGQVLLVVGTVLTSAQIGMLGKRGVRSLTITQPQLQSGMGARQVLGLDRELRQRFVRCDMQHPVIKEVYRLALMRQVQQAMQGRGPHAG